MGASNGGFHPQVARSRAAAMEAARDILLSDGPEAVGYVAVAERSGIGRTTLYRHWPSIEHLLRDVLARECEVAHSPLTGDLRTDLVNELEGLRRQLTADTMQRPLIAIMERASRDPEFASLCTELHEACSLLLGKILRAAAVRGEIESDVDVARATAELLGPIFYWQLVCRQPMSQFFIPGIVDDFLRSHRSVSA